MASSLHGKEIKPKARHSDSIIDMIGVALGDKDAFAEELKSRSQGRS